MAALHTLLCIRHGEVDWIENKIAYLYSLRHILGAREPAVWRTLLKRLVEIKVEWKL
jgi:hypothetical protein